MGPLELLKARHVGIRELKDNLSGIMHSKEPVVATDHGQPLKAVVDYGDLVALLELVKDLTDDRMMKSVGRGVKAMAKGGGTSAGPALDRLRRE
ncbi:type II toxin-antitoxin system Phd/YefM family antitoxin [bacterium]|nr:MAG: type II toxin-antitoxin system Phd/YefM family antitoxin [bacterium]